VFAGDKIISYSEKPFRGSMEWGTGRPALARKEKEKRKEDYGDRGRGMEGEARAAKKFTDSVSCLRDLRDQIGSRRSAFGAIRPNPISMASERHEKQTRNTSTAARYRTHRRTRVLCTRHAIITAPVMIIDAIRRFIKQRKVAPRPISRAL